MCLELRNVCGVVCCYVVFSNIVLSLVISVIGKLCVRCKLRLSDINVVKYVNVNIGVISDRRNVCKMT